MFVGFFEFFGFFRLVQYGSLWVLFVAFGERFYEGLISILNPEMLLGR